jgi:hypothetical protein
LDAKCRLAIRLVYWLTSPVHIENKKGGLQIILSVNQHEVYNICLAI